MITQTRSKDWWLPGLDLSQFPNHIRLDMMNPLVIGIAGKAGSGKDTFAKLLKQALESYAILSLIDIYARPIKEAYVAKYGGVLNFMYEDTHDFEWKKQVNPFTNTTHRQEFQFDGTEGTRTRTGNPNVWVQHLWARYNSCTGALLVPDTRFDNEIDFSLSNGLVIKVVRPDQEEIEHSNHASEVVVDDSRCDFIVYNRGTLDQLAGIAGAIVSALCSESQAFPWWEDKHDSIMKNVLAHREFTSVNLDYKTYKP